MIRLRTRRLPSRRSDIMGFGRPKGARTGVNKRMNIRGGEREGDGTEQETREGKKRREETREAAEI